MHGKQKTGNSMCICMCKNIDYLKIYVITFFIGFWRSEVNQKCLSPVTKVTFKCHFNYIKCSSILNYILSIQSVNSQLLHKLKHSSKELRLFHEMAPFSHVPQVLFNPVTAKHFTPFSKIMVQSNILSLQ